MKNTHIQSLQQEVPIELRLELYKKALSMFKFNSQKLGYNYFSDGLCLLLPYLLWDLNLYTDKAPNGQSWYLDEVSIAFPELTVDIIKHLNSSDRNPRYLLRKEYLEQFIKSIEETLNNTKS